MAAFPLRTDVQNFDEVRRALTKISIELGSLSSTGGAPSLAPPSGVSYSGAYNNTDIGAGYSALANTLYATPIVLNQELTISHIVLPVSTGGGGGSAVQGIYSAGSGLTSTGDTTIYPTTKVSQTSQFSVISAGYKKTSLSLTLPAGVSFMVFWPSVNITVAATSFHMFNIGVNPDVSNNPIGISSLSFLSTYSITLPATFPSSAVPVLNNTGSAATRQMVVVA